MDELTDGEKAYLESGGENTDGLIAESKGEVKTETTPTGEIDPAITGGIGKSQTVVDSEVKPEVKPETKVEAKPETAEAEDDEEPETGKPVSRTARQRKKLQDKIAELETKLNESNERFTRGDERLKLLTEALQQPAQEEKEEDPEPDPNLDIVGAANWQKREIGRLREALTQMQGTIQETTTEQRLQDEYKRDAIAFARENPDFMNGYNHLISARVKTLEAQRIPRDQIAKILYSEERGLVEQARAAGIRPSLMIYEMAKSMGYQMAAPAAVTPAVNGNGAAPINGAPEPPKPSVTEEIERIARGQAASKSLSDTGGSANELTVEALANMSEREFNALYASKKGQIDALLGKQH